MSAAQHAESLKRAQALLERVLRPGRSDALSREYPLVFSPRFPGRLVALEEHGDVRSACAFLVRELVIPGARIRAGLIGSVATDPAWRGRGLASQVLAEAERCLSREGCMLALLWADEPSFYRQRGWRPIGTEIDFLLESERLGALQRPDGIRAAAPDDFAAIHRLYLRHPERVDRSGEETSALLAGPGVETLVLCRGRDIAAYTCSGRGADLAHTVHEWGGEASEVVALAGEHLRRSLARGSEQPLALMSPPTSRALHVVLQGLGARAIRGVLGMGKLLDVEPAAELLARFGGEGLRVELEAGGSEGARVLLDSPSGRRVFSQDELLSLLFAPASDRAAVEALECELSCSLPGLPLSPFVWGLDSI